MWALNRVARVESVKREQASLVARYSRSPPMPHGYAHVRTLASNRQSSEGLAEVFERDDEVIVVLADGAGGIRGGVAASRVLVDGVRSAVSSRTFAADDVRGWADLFQATDRFLAANHAGETSGVLVVLGARGIAGVSAGDSEAWVVTPAQVDDLTTGQHTKSRLGTGRAVPVTFQRAALEGVLLVGTDGLFKYASKEVIARIVRASSIGRTAEELVELVRLPSGRFADEAAIFLATRKPSSPVE
jgi:serine/threonine protein phosphatase PrpC